MVNCIDITGTYTGRGPTATTAFHISRSPKKYILCIVLWPIFSHAWPFLFSVSTSVAVFLSFFCETLLGNWRLFRCSCVPFYLSCLYHINYLFECFGKLFLLLPFIVLISSFGLSSDTCLRERFYFPSVLFCVIIQHSAAYIVIVQSCSVHLCNAILVNQRSEFNSTWHFSPGLAIV